MFNTDQTNWFRHYLRQFAEDGNCQAYEQLGQILNQARDTLRGVAIRWDVPAHDAEDVAGNALSRAIDKNSLRTLWENYGDNADPEIYLRMELRGAISDYRRRQRPIPVGSLEQMWEGGRDIAVFPQPPALRPKKRQTLWRTIRECLGNDLDPQILWLMMDYGLTGKRTAELLCISHENVRRRFKDAIKKLRGCEALARDTEDLEPLP